jgi:hypothetical protein
LAVGLPVTALGAWALQESRAAKAVERRAQARRTITAAAGAVGAQMKQAFAAAETIELLCVAPARALVSSTLPPKSSAEARWGHRSRWRRAAS